MINKVSLSHKLSLFDDHWSPRTIATYNGSDVMVVKVDGEFVWHIHEDTDDFFLVLQGELEIELEDRTICLQAGDLYVVPKGVKHRTVARQGVAHLLLMEPSGTANTGDSATAAKRKLA
jgi:mannose-6-phosphate isomerase-like protein (cupin superfamily)